MKTDELNIFHRHAEKLVLGIGGFVLLVTLVTQFFLGEPNAIEIKGKDYAPGQVNELVDTEVRRLDNLLKGPEQIEVIEIPTYADTFKKLFDLPVAATAGLGAPLEHQIQIPLRIRVPNYKPMFLPTPPMPVDILAKSGNGVLVPADDQDNLGLRNIIGEQTPADFPYVSVLADFEFSQWVLRLEAAARPEDERIPPSLWRPRLVITGVYLLRQELDLSTGDWGNETRVDPLPGQFSILSRDNRPRPLSEALDLEDRIKDEQALILRSRFPAISNGPWTPPDVSNRVYTAEQKAEQDAIKKKMDNVQRRIENYKKNGRPTESLHQEMIQLERDLNRSLGIDDPGPSRFTPDSGMGFQEPPFGAGPGQPGRPGEEGGGTKDKVEIWGHDLTVEHGKTYRYKVVASVLNPLFRQSRLPEDQRKENFDRIALPPADDEIVSSNWSAKVSLPPKYHYFVTGGNLDQKRVDVETWTIFDGEWQKSEFKEFPGNEIGDIAIIQNSESTTSIPMNVGARLVDVDSVSSGGTGFVSQTSLRAIIFDPNTGRISERLVNQDKKNPERSDLEDRIKKREKPEDDNGFLTEADRRGY